MPQSLSVLTLGVAGLAASKRFYGEGFGWRPVFENEEIVFYQLNGLVFGTWLKAAMDADLGRPSTPNPSPVSLAHNVGSEDEVLALMRKLVAAGGRELRPAGAPPHGGYRGHVADPDGHAWEIAWNPAFSIDVEGRVTFGL